VLFTDASKNLWALGLFAFAAFSLAALAQEFWQGASARRSLSGGSIPAALLGVAARNRRRYGGYIVHAGIAVLLIGIAASSSFQTNRDISLRPGQSAKVNGYEMNYRRPTVDVNDRRIAFGAVLDVRRDGKRFALLTPSRQYFRPTGVPTRTIRSFFEGEATSEVGLKAGLRKDFWTAMQPNISGVERRARMADEKFRALMAVVAQRVRQDPWPGRRRRALRPAGARPHRRQGRPPLPQAVAPGHLPRDRQPARLLDVDRGADRPRRRRDRDLADTGGAPPPRQQPLRGAPRPRALARLTAPR
jgi:cytochrome c-type biogenesis protein CcmF